MRQTNSADLLPSFHVEVVKLMMIEIVIKVNLMLFHNSFWVSHVEVTEQAAIT